VHFLESALHSYVKWSAVCRSETVNKTDGKKLMLNPESVFLNRPLFLTVILAGLDQH